MNGYNFTERTRRILSYAREEAVRLASPFTDVDHILLGLIREREGVGAYVLEMLAGDLSTLSNDLEKAMHRIEATTSLRPDVPYTSRAKRVLEHSMAVARELRHNYVGSEHLLLGVLREGQSPGARLLSERGADYESAQKTLLRVLGAPDASIGTTGVRAVGAEIELQMSDGTTRREHFTSLREAVRFMGVHELQ